MPMLLAAALLAVSPCKLVGAANASATLGGPVGKPKAQTLGLYQSCTYSHGTATLTVQTRMVSRSDFVKSAKANPAPVKPVSVGAGAIAYSAAGFTLLVWRNGTEATFTVVGAGNGIAAETALAKKVVAKI
jgi:hypothetical protein